MGTMPNCRLQKYRKKFFFRLGGMNKSGFGRNFSVEHIHTFIIEGKKGWHTSAV